METTPYTTSNQIIEYRKNGIFIPNLVNLIVTPLMFFIAFQTKLSSFEFYALLLLGIIGTIFLIYSIRDYIINKLIIGEDYLVINNKRIPSYSIREVERKRYNIKLKTVNQNIVIDMKNYLAFSDEEAVNEVYKRLAEFVPGATEK